MKWFKRYVKVGCSLLVFITCGQLTLCAQTKRIDRLRTLLQLNRGAKVQPILLQLCEQYFSLSADSLKSYVELGLSLSVKNGPDYFRFKNYYCFYYLKLGKAPEANKYMDSLMAASKRLKINQSIIKDLQFHKSVALIRNNEIKEAIQSSLQLLELSEKIGDTLAVLRAYSLLGWANMELESEHEAIRWLNKGLNYSKNKNLLANANSVCLNIASCYNLIEKSDSANKYVQLGLRYSREVENLTSEANALNIRAAIYSKENKISEALKDLEEALLIRQKIGDMHYIIADMAQLSHFYAYINQPDKGIAIALKAIPMAIESNNLYKLIYLKKGLYKNYETAHRKDDQLKTILDILDLKDSLYEQNTVEAIAEIKTQYELQKKENIIIKQQHNLDRNRYLTIGGILSILLASIIIWLLYRNRTHRQKLAMEQALIKEKLHSLQAIKQAEEKERKRIAADLHDNLGSYAAAISSNIRYLKMNDGNDNIKMISQLDENAQGIVTQLGDTIWVLKNESLPVTKLADRFKAWAQRLIQNYPEVVYHYKEDIQEDVELTPATVLNIFLILKECLNNALKHSYCQSIWIEIGYDKSLRIQMKDDGIGFSANENKHGNGIENVQYRAKECGLQVVWENLHPAGTKITISGNTTN